MCSMCLWLIGSTLGIYFKHVLRNVKSYFLKQSSIFSYISNAFCLYGYFYCTCSNYMEFGWNKLLREEINDSPLYCSSFITYAVLHSVGKLSCKKLCMLNEQTSKRDTKEYLCSNLKILFQFLRNISVEFKSNPLVQEHLLSGTKDIDVRDTALYAKDIRYTAFHRGETGMQLLFVFGWGYY